MQREEKYITRGVGYSWTELKPKPGLNLFGGGGEIDGPVATITDSHADNVQEEEARTLDAQGRDGALDQATNPNPEDAANANKEFNHAQFKASARDDMMQIDLSTAQDGVSAGDILIVNDPRNSTFNQTSDALESVVGKLYEPNPKNKKDVKNDISYKTPNNAINPFSQRSYAKSMVQPKAHHPKEEKGETMGAVEKQAKDDGLEYYFASSNMKTDEQTLEKMQHNRHTGLRRTKTMKTQSALKAHLQVKDEIDDANNEAYELFKSERQGLKATLSNQEHKETIDRIRNPQNKYLAVQSGLASASQKAHKRYKRSQTTKLNQTLL
jgi:hypothetical protein